MCSQPQEKKTRKKRRKTKKKEEKDVSVSSSPFLCRRLKFWGDFAKFMITSSVIAAQGLTAVFGW